MGTLSLTDPVNGTTADATLIATNNAAIKTVVNGGIDDSNLASGADISISKLENYPGDGTKVLFGDGTWNVPGSSGVPVGAISMYGGASAPAGWLLLDGTTFSTSTYSSLFSVLGTGTLPDMRGRMPVGYAASGGHTDVSTLFNNDGVAQSHRRPKHRHTVANGTNVLQDTVSGPAYGSGGSHASLVSIGVGNDTTNDPLDAPAYMVVNFIIKT